MSDNYTTTKGTIAEIDRIASSANANPRYRVTLVGGANLNTGVDAAIGYAITNPEWKNTPVVFTLKRNGDIVGIRTEDGRHADGPQG